MSANGLRITVLNGIFMILVGLFMAGVPLAWTVQHEVYGQSTPFSLTSDYRGWKMAHLQGLLNGFLVIVLAGASCIKKPMKIGREKWLIPALLVMGWGNVVASVLAPMLGVRGIAIDAEIANNIIYSIFTIGVLGTVAAVGGIIAHLWKPMAE